MSNYLIIILLFYNPASAKKIQTPSEINIAKVNYCNEQKNDTIINEYSKSLEEYFKGNKDSAFLKNLAVSAKMKKDTGIVKKVVKDYIDIVRKPLIESNIDFLLQFINDVHDPAFIFLFKNRQNGNVIVKGDAIDFSLILAIENSEIKPSLTFQAQPNWDSVGHIIKSKYGLLGEEAFLQSKAFATHNYNNRNDSLFKKTIEEWFQKYGKKRRWIDARILNEFSWRIFETSFEKKSLKIAEQMMLKAISMNPDGIYLDTYANILYKLGHKTSAIEWQKKAVQSRPEHKEIQSNLDKMLSGLPTWN